MVEKILDKEIEEKVLKADHPVILDFWNQGCAPCQALGPVLEDLSEKEKDINFYSICIDEGEEAAKRFRVMTVPTLLFIKDGEVKKKTIGFRSKESITAVIEEQLRA